MPTPPMSDFRVYESVYLKNDVEATFSVQVQRKRRRLADLLAQRADKERVIMPYKKAFKGADVNNFRGSKFRGISKNGNSWQILVMVNRKKKYLGTLPDEELAARFYDKVAIQNQGVKAKTNFTYSKEEIVEILKLENLIQSRGGFD